MAIKFNLNECVFLDGKVFLYPNRHSNGVWEEGDIVQSIVQEILREK